MKTLLKVLSIALLTSCITNSYTMDTTYIDQIILSDIYAAKPAQTVAEALVTIAPQAIEQMQQAAPEEIQAAATATEKLATFAGSIWNSVKSSRIVTSGLEYAQTCNGFKGAYAQLPTIKPSEALETIKTASSNGWIAAKNFMGTAYAAMTTENARSALNTIKETIQAHPYATGGTLATVLLAGATYSAYKARVAEDKACLRDFLQKMNEEIAASDPAQLPAPQTIEDAKPEINKGNAVRSRSKFALLKDKLNTRR